MLYDPPLYPQQPDQIILEALSTLGLDLDYLAQLTQVDSKWLLRHLKSKDLLASEWIALCDALYLQVDSISYGYFRRSHRVNVKRAICSGYYYLPKTREYWFLRWEYLHELSRDWMWQGQHYGFRLRWKVRLLNFLQWIKARRDLWNLSYDPREAAKSIFQTYCSVSDMESDLPTEKALKSVFHAPFSYH